MEQEIHPFHHDHVCESCPAAWPHQAPRCELSEEYPCIEHGGSIPEIHRHRCPACREHWNHGEAACDLPTSYSCHSHLPPRKDTRTRLTSPSADMKAFAAIGK